MNFFIITEDIKFVFFSQAKHSNVITLSPSPPPSASPQNAHDILFYGIVHTLTPAATDTGSWLTFYVAM